MLAVRKTKYKPAPAVLTVLTLLIDINKLVFFEKRSGETTPEPQIIEIKIHVSVFL